MTAPSAQAGSEMPRSRYTFAVLSGSLALFFVCLSFLAAQMRAAGAPSLVAAAKTPAIAPRRVVIRKVIRTTVVTRVIAPRAPRPAPPTPQTGGGGSAPTQYVVVAAAPSPAPVASPAPQPVTRAS